MKSWTVVLTGVREDVKNEKFHVWADDEDQALERAMANQRIWNNVAVAGDLVMVAEYKGTSK